MYVVGVDIGGTKCVITLAEWDQGEITFCTRERFLTRVERGPECILQEIENIIVRFIDSLDGCISAIGISCGGPLDGERGIIMSPPNLPLWDNICIVERFEGKFNIPVFLENDANAGALAEWQFGAGAGCENVVFLTFGTGLGAGMVLNGKLYRGASGLAGELGHWRLLYGESPENYGKMGGFQGLCSGNGIAEWYQFLRQDEDTEYTSEQVAKLAVSGDPIAEKVFRQSAEYLGKGLSLLIDLLSPDVVAIGGVFGHAYDLLWPAASQVLRQETLSQALEHTLIVPSKLANDIGDYASCLVAVMGSTRESVMLKHL